MEAERVRDVLMSADALLYGAGIGEGHEDPNLLRVCRAVIAWASVIEAGRAWVDAIEGDASGLDCRDAADKLRKAVRATGERAATEET